MNRLQEIDNEIAKLQAEREKLTIWEPKGGKWFIYLDGCGEQDSSAEACCNFGMERETKELALKALKAMRKHNRLLAYRDEVAPGYEFKLSEPNYYVELDRDGGVWSVDGCVGFEIPGAVYFPTLELAQELADKLNDGRVVL